MAAACGVGLTTIKRWRRDGVEETPTQASPPRPVAKPKRPRAPQPSPTLPAAAPASPDPAPPPIPVTAPAEAEPALPPAPAAAEPPDLLELDSQAPPAPVPPAAAAASTRPEGPLPQIRLPRAKPPPAKKPTPKPPKKPKAPAASKTVKDLLAAEDQDLEPGDEFADITVPADFDAIRLLKKIANSPRTSAQLRLRAAQIIAAHENARGKGRIPWESIRLETIPDEVKHRLAGMLLASVSWAELPEEVRLASAPRRRVWRVVGILPGDDVTAEAILARLDAAVAELRVELAPAAVAVERAPLKITVAAETRVGAASGR